MCFISIIFRLLHSSWLLGCWSSVVYFLCFIERVTNFMNPHTSKKYGSGELDFTCLCLQSSWQVWGIQLATLKVDIHVYILYAYVFVCTYLQVELKWWNLEILFFTYTRIIYRLYYKSSRDFYGCCFITDLVNQLTKTRK